MGEMLVSIIFKVLNFIASVFLTPIFSVINTIIPAVGDFFSSIFEFIGYGLQYVGFFVKLLMIPQGLLITLVGFFVGIFAFNLTIRVVGLGMAIYKYFKP